MSAFSKGAAGAPSGINGLLSLGLPPEDNMGEERRRAAALGPSKIGKLS